MKPAPDDSPDPLRSTPKRLADELLAVGLVAVKLEIRARQLAPFLTLYHLDGLLGALSKAADIAVDLGSAVRVGSIPIAAPLVDRSPGADDRPLIELAEGNRKPPFDPIQEPNPIPIQSADVDLERQAAAFEPATEPRNGFVELPDERRKAADASWEQNEEAHRYLGRAAEPKVEAAACNRCNQVRPLAVHPCPKCSCPEYRVITVAAGSIEIAEPAKPARRESAMKAAETRRQNRQRELDDLAAVAMRNQAQPEPPDVIDRDFERVLEAESDANAEEAAGEYTPEQLGIEISEIDGVDGLTGTPGRTIALPTDADERKARKREADRKYQAAKKAKRDLDRAIGNPIEGDGSPLPPFRGREPVIDRPTAPAKSMSPESDRTWEVFDTRVDPHTLMGTVVGANITRASIAAEQCWPDLPKRMFKIIEKIARGRRPANRLDEADVAEFRRSFDADGERAAERLERTEPAPEPATKRGRRKFSGTSTVIGEDRAERIAAEARAMRSEVET